MNTLRGLIKENLLLEKRIGQISANFEIVFGFDVITTKHSKDRSGGREELEGYNQRPVDNKEIVEVLNMFKKDIAEKIGMDISTISRVANSKYVQTDFGIYPLKYFFSEGILSDSGEEVSNREVKKILSDAVSQEDKKIPLTDEALMAILREKGYNIARRTVAKYREQLNIPVARLRKEL
jgi:transcriptional regulator with XRE-family HTH domain